MIHYTVVIPQRDRAEAVGALLPQLEQVLEALEFPYEIICVDDGSSVPARRALEELLGRHAHFRVLHFEDPRGTSASLTAGVAAARGDLVIALAPDTRTSVRYIPHLIAELSRADLVIARRQSNLANEIRQRLARLLAGTARLHESEELFWAARREAVSGLELARGAFRLLGPLVARRGFRVRQLTIANGRPVRGTPLYSGLVTRLAAAWFDRHFEPHRASELAVEGGPRPWLRPAHAAASRGRVMPQPTLTPAQNEHRDSA